MNDEQLIFQITGNYQKKNKTFFMDIRKAQNPELLLVL